MTVALIPASTKAHALSTRMVQMDSDVSVARSGQDPNVRCSNMVACPIRV